MLDRSSKPDRIAYYESELALPPLPMELAYLWRAFWRLRRRKGSNGFEPNPIEWPDIDAFERHANMRLVPWEIEVIEMLDDLYRVEHARAVRGDQPNPEGDQDR